jgi:hypothetical protein
MASISGIHSNIMFSKDNDKENGEFLSPTESIIQGSKEASNIKSNNEGDESWAHFYL